MYRVLATAFLMAGSWLAGYTITFKNHTDTAWTMRVELSGVAVCKDDDVAIPAHATKMYQTKKIATNCCVKRILNKEALENDPENGEKYIFDPRGSLTNCQSFQVDIDASDGAFSVSKYGNGATEGELKEVFSGSGSGSSSGHPHPAL